MRNTARKAETQKVDETSERWRVTYGSLSREVVVTFDSDRVARGAIITDQDEVSRAELTDMDLIALFGAFRAGGYKMKGE